MKKLQLFLAVDIARSSNRGVLQHSIIYSTKGKTSVSHHSLVSISKQKDGHETLHSCRQRKRVIYSYRDVSQCRS